MYSKASYKDQLRQVRIVMVEHKNTGGIDETAFKQTEMLPERKPIADRSWILPPEPAPDATLDDWMTYRKNFTQIKNTLELARNKLTNEIQMTAQRAYHSRKFDPKVQRLKKRAGCIFGAA